MKLLLVILALIAAIIALLLEFIAPNQKIEMVALCFAVFFLCCSHFARS